jgi:hypothetical protein
MLYSEPPTIPQTRLRCRHPRCGALLKTPAADPRDAFCRKSCEVGFYRVRCRVCEQLFSPKIRRRVVCWRARCRHEMQRHPERYFGSQFPCVDLAHNAKNPGGASPIAGLVHNEENPLTKSRLNTAQKSGRGYRVVAGPAADPINFRNWPELPPRTTLIKRTSPPVNVIGGYRFPGAPTVDLAPSPASPKKAPAPRDRSEP